jgi:hypothetical protein
MLQILINPSKRGGDAMMRTGYFHSVKRSAIGTETIFTMSEKRQFNQVSVKIHFWHKATIRRAGTVHGVGAVINLQHVVRNLCNEVVN